MANRPSILFHLFTVTISLTISFATPLSFKFSLTISFAPNGSTIPSDNVGGSFGLTKEDDELFNSTSNPFVAVEFDIYRNYFDPDYDHVGIDINSLNSSNAVQWSSDVIGGKRNEAWISYNSSTHNLSVIFTDSVTKFKYFSYSIDLRLYLPELVTFGFSAATGDSYAKQTIYSWEFSSNLEIDDPATHDSLPPPSSNPSVHRVPRRRGNKIGLVVGLSIGGGVLVAGLVLVWLSGIGRKRGSDDEEDNQRLRDYMDDEFEKETGPKKFSYKELAAATNNFNDERKLGQGGFGGVYKGFLRDTNSSIAVKRVSRESKQGIKEYASEVKIISRLRHRNLVQLLGWCHEKKELLLVYEFMPNRSLNSHLFKENSLLTWEIRYKIAQDLASGLLYLHEEWEQCVLHRDIKSSNIMLDSNFNAKIGDFGLARLVEHVKGSQTTVLAGTMGYVAPECVITGKASKESDVYSFGIVALEIACGSKPINPWADESQVYMVQWVWELYGSGKLLEAADPRLRDDFDAQQMKRLMIVGLWCAHPDEHFRPPIRQAIHLLCSEDSLPILPAKMPVAVYFPAPVNTPIYQSSSYSYNTNSS